jgi:origin recognition complex subunit 5
LTDAIVVAFPRLSKADALSSLLIDVHQLIQSDKRHSLPFQSLLNIHETFREVAYDSFASEIRDMDEIRLLACCVWYPYIEPLLQGVVPANKATSLLLRGSFLFRDALSRLHTREIAPAEWVQEMVNHVKRDCEAEVAKGVAGQRPILPSSKTMLLPLIPSFLLLASFLASYNPARLDVRYFVRDESFLLPEAGVKNGHSSKKRKSTNRRGTEGNRQEMLGPKTFTMDRLLSIFQALMAEAGPEMDVWVGEEESQVKSDWWEIKSKSVGVMEGVNALIRINALVRTSANEKLESTTLFRTNVTFETAMQVSKRPSFDLEEWLWDWR